MRIMVIGAGYVGLITGLCLAEFGFEIVCIDKDENKIKSLQQGISPIYEQDIEKLLEKHLATNAITFAQDLSSYMTDIDLIIIAVGTPSLPNGNVDLTCLVNVSLEVAPYLDKYVPIVIKSTVPPGTCRTIKQTIIANNINAKFNIISNPEFLREGSSIHDFMHPDRIIIGLENNANKEIMSELYGELIIQNIPVIFTDLETSEMIKYASNSLLATKIAFINEMADVCEQIGADVEVLAHGVGLDKRIGQCFLKPGPGFGGSCFPKDTLGLKQLAINVDRESKIVTAVIEANQNRIVNCAHKVVEHCGGDINEVNIAILGIAFKANTDDIRQSPALEIVDKLQKSGANISLFDPVALDNAKIYFGDKVNYSASAMECVMGANVVIFLTEWDEFTKLEIAKISQSMQQLNSQVPKMCMDFRNLFKIEDFLGTDIKYISVGRKVNTPVMQDTNIYEY